MNKHYKNKQPKNIGKMIAKFFFGFFLPYILINGLILFLFIQSPKINILESDAKDYEENKIKFTIDCMLPIINIKAFFQDQEIPYTKFGAYYMIDSKNNGTYQIVVTSLNKATVNSYVNIETMDGEPPKINTTEATITGGILSLTITDDQTGINYDNVYGIKEDLSTISPSYIDKASGTVQFDFDNITKLTIHVEDNYGNSAETTFNAG